MESEQINIGSVITLDGFEKRKFVISNIYKGGMGIVYQLIPITPFLDAIALKTYIHEAFSDDFSKEAITWFSLGGHPNIAKPFWYGIFNNQPAILAEWYISTANDFQVNPNHIDQTYKFINGILSGLIHAYDYHGILHRDIKPTNILLDKYQNPKISDFGVSVSIFEKTKTIAGTRKYLAPEIFIGYAQSIQTDIYALGVTLFEVITKQDYIDFDNIDQIKQELIRSNILLNNCISPVIDLILSSIQPIPSYRAASYQELIKILDQKFHKPVSTVNQIDLNESASQATILQKQGRTDESVKILKKALLNYPNDILLLFTLGNCYLFMGKNEIALPIFENVVNTLIEKKGLYNERVFPEPFANLCEIYINSRKFEKAVPLVEFLIKLSTEKDARISFLFPEIGWYHLYKGNFDQAIQSLMTVFKSMDPNHLSIQWLVLSAYFSGHFPSYSSYLSSTLLNSFQNFDTDIAMLALLIADVSKEPERSELQIKALGDSYANLRQIADDLGLGYEFERLPLTKEAKSVIISSLDYYATEGKYNGILY